MIKFVRAPFWNNWFKGNFVDKSIIVVSPYFKKNALDAIIDEFQLDNDNCKLDIKVLIRGKLSDFLQGSSDITALDALLALRCIDIDNVRRVTNLHMKAYLRDYNDLLIGSGNCTEPGLSTTGRLGNIEGGIRTDDKSTIEEFKCYFEEIFQNAQPLEDFYDDIISEYTKEASTPFKVQPSISAVNKAELSQRYDYRINIKNLHPEALKNSEMSVNDIPQFSNFDIITKEVLEVLNKARGEGKYLTFEELGRQLPGQLKDNVVAQKKYGENHAKTAELLSFAVVLPERPRRIIITQLGKNFLAANPEEKKTILIRQLLKMTIVKDVFYRFEKSGTLNIDEYLKEYLKESTVKRRKPNVRHIFKLLADYGVEGATELYEAVFKN